MSIELSNFVRLRHLESNTVVKQLQGLSDKKVIYILPYSSKLLVSLVSKAALVDNLPWDTSLISHQGYGKYSNAPVVFLNEGGYLSAETNPQHPNALTDVLDLIKHKDQYVFVFVYPKWGTDVLSKPSIDVNSSALAKAWANTKAFLSLRKYCYISFHDVSTGEELLQSTLNYLSNVSNLSAEQDKNIAHLYEVLDSQEPIAPEDLSELSKLVVYYSREHYQVLLSRLNPNNKHQTRDEIKQTVLNYEPVQEAILAMARKTAKTSDEQAKAVTEQKQNAEDMIEEIASDVKFSMLKRYDFYLRLLWNRFYSKINVNGLERLRKTLYSTHHASFVYACTHRSHIDYLLISYILNEWGGIKTPHIAAGVNLNFKPVGGIFRRGGAFFIRRSFNNFLYATIFKSYIAELIKQRQDIEFFIEGGRSRSGRLLQPKTGVLNMTIEGFLRNPSANLFYVPIFICYDKVIESSTYVSELQGKKKDKESVLLVLKNLRNIKYQGNVYVNFAKPLLISNYFDTIYPNWVEDVSKDNIDRELIAQISNAMSRDTMVNINANATISGQALLSAVLYHSKGEFSRDELLANIDFIRNIVAKNVQFHPEYEVVDTPSQQILDKILAVLKKHVLINTNQKVKFNPNVLPELNYYRNNVEHCFIAPSLAAIMHLNNLSAADLEQFCKYFTQVINYSSFVTFSESGLISEVQYFYNELVAVDQEKLELLAKQLYTPLHQFRAVLECIHQFVINANEQGESTENLQLSRIVSDVLTNLKLYKDIYPDFADKTTINQLRLAFESAKTIDYSNVSEIDLALASLNQWFSHSAKVSMNDK